MTAGAGERERCPSDHEARDTFRHLLDTLDGVNEASGLSDSERLRMASALGAKLRGMVGRTADPRTLAPSRADAGEAGEATRRALAASAAWIDKVESPAPDSGGAASEAKRYSRDSLPGVPSEWPLYRKHAPTRAKRIWGPFVVETSEGTLRCEDGYLAVDARGYPYPIASDEFQRIYEPAQSPSPPASAKPEGEARAWSCERHDWIGVKAHRCCDEAVPLYARAAAPASGAVREALAFYADAEHYNKRLVLAETMGGKVPKGCQDPLQHVRAAFAGTAAEGVTGSEGVKHYCAAPDPSDVEQVTVEHQPRWWGAPLVMEDAGARARAALAGDGAASERPRDVGEKGGEE